MYIEPCTQVKQIRKMHTRIRLLTPRSPHAKSHLDLQNENVRFVYTYSSNNFPCILPLRRVKGMRKMHTRIGLITD